MIELLPLGPERDSAILSSIVSGFYEPIRWSPLVSANANHCVKLWVAEDALKIDSVRVSVSHRLAQQIADLFDCRLPTTKVSDLVWEQASVRFNAMPQPWFADGSMASTARMIEYSRIVDAKIAGRTGLVASIGKDWVLSRKLTPNVGANYGFHYTKLASARVWQPLGTAHNLDHHDYSQSLRLVCRTVEADGKRMPYDTALRSKELAPLLSTEGALPFVRHPGVAWSEPLIEIEMAAWPT